MVPRVVLPAAALTVLAAVLATSLAQAQTKEQCLAAHEAGQSLRRQGKLRASREQVLACLHESCPGLVRADCSRLLEQVEASVPTIVVEGKDKKGTPTTAIRVLIDGAVTLERLDGRALPLDPGEHRLRFESPDGIREQSIVVVEGQKNQKILADFEDHARAPARLGAVSADVDVGRSQRTIGFIVGAAGLASLTVGAISGVLALDAAGDATCKSPCFARDATGAPNPKLQKADDAYDRANTLAWVTNITLGVGIAAAAVGTYLILTSRGTSGRAAWIAPAPLPNGVAMTWGGAL